MGNVVVFRRGADLAPLDVASNRRSASPESKDWPAASEAGIPRSADAGRSTSLTPPIVSNRFGLTRFARGTGKHPDHDAYLLVLLADQELTAGRDDEARSLLDAAYTAFDRWTGDHRGLRQAGEHG